MARAPADTEGALVGGGSHVWVSCPERLQEVLMSLPVPISLLHSARALSPGESVQGGVGPAPCPSRGWPREWAELGQPMAKAGRWPGKRLLEGPTACTGWARNGGWSLTSTGCRCLYGKSQVLGCGGSLVFWVS